MGATLANLAQTAPRLAWLLAAAVAAGVLLAATGLAAASLRRSAPAARHQLWTLGVLGALAMPILAWLAPATLSPWRFPMPAAVDPLVAPAVVIWGGARAVSSLPSWPTIAAIVWAFGALVVALRFARGHVAARRLGRDAGPAPAAWGALAREIATGLGLSGEVRLGRSEAIASPMALGVLRPRVLLPAAADAWPADRLRAILAHELGHVRRRDTLVQLLVQLATSLYWWNPLVWLAAGRLRVERERACDDLVLGLGALPSSYAGDLLDVERSLGAAPRQLGVACIVERGGTEARIRRVLDPRAPRRAPGRAFRLVAGGAVLAIAVTLACTSVAPHRDWHAQAVEVLPASADAVLSLGGPAVAAGDPLIGLTFEERAAFSAVLDPQRGALETCYQRRLAARPDLKGAVKVQLVVAANGAVLAREVREDTLGDAEVLACVNDAIEQTSFPSLRGTSADIVVPFLFGVEGDGC